MPAEHFANVIRGVKKDLAYAAGIYRSACARLAALGVGWNRRSAVKGIPAGSDNHNLGSILAWMDKVKSEDAEAVGQLQAMAATAAAVEGK